MLFQAPHAVASAFHSIDMSASLVCCSVISRCADDVFQDNPRPNAGQRCCISIPTSLDGRPRIVLPLWRLSCSRLTFGKTRVCAEDQASLSHVTAPFRVHNRIKAHFSAFTPTPSSLANSLNALRTHQLLADLARAPTLSHLRLFSLSLPPPGLPTGHTI